MNEAHVCGNCDRFHPFIDAPNDGTCILEGEPQSPKQILVSRDQDCKREQLMSYTPAHPYFISKVKT